MRGEMGERREGRGERRDKMRGNKGGEGRGD